MAKKLLFDERASGGQFLVNITESVQKLNDPTSDPVFGSFHQLLCQNHSRNAERRTGKSSMREPDYAGSCDRLVFILCRGSSITMTLPLASSSL